MVETIVVVIAILVAGVVAQRILARGEEPTWCDGCRQFSHGDFCPFCQEFDDEEPKP